jgi:MFS family permease
MIESAPTSIPASPADVPSGSSEFTDGRAIAAPLDRELRVRRVGPFLLIGQAAWAIPGGVANTLLAAVIADISPDHKVAIFTAYAVAGALTSAIGTVVGGLLSDRTRSRLGRRAPWLLGASVLAAVALSATAFTEQLFLTGVLFAIFQLGIGAYVAALAALIPDHVAPGSVGRASAWSGFGYLVGQTVGGVVAGTFVTNPHVGLIISPWVMVLGAVAIVLFVRGRDSRSGVSSARTIRLSDLVPHGSRDFWLAFLGRFLFILAILMVITFELYILTDYLHLSTANAGKVISLGTLLVGLLSAIGVIVSGVLSDRTHRIKPFVIVTPLILALGLVPLLVAPGLVTVFIFFGAIGLTLGAYLAVDQALMVAVLPDAATAARDIGFLSIGSTLPAVVAPIVGGLVAATLGYVAVFVIALVFAIAAAAVIFGIRSVR